MAERMITELRCKGMAHENDRPNLPRSSEGVVHDAVEGREVGASSLHGRELETGEPRDGVELQEEVCREVRENTARLLHPTLGYITQMDIEERIEHVLAGTDGLAPAGGPGRERLEPTLSLSKEHGVPDLAETLGRLVVTPEQARES